MNEEKDISFCVAAMISGC